MVGAVSLDWIPPLRQPRKAKVKPVQPTYRYDIRALYYDSRVVMFRREYPSAWAAGEYYENHLPDVTTTNGITRYIEDVVNNYGHHAERINTMGIPITVKGKVTWRRSGSTKGSADIHCIVCGRTWKIEVKKAADILNPSQEKYRDKMLKIGVYHSVIKVGDIDSFWDEFYRIVKL